jgi:hypothetical protein
MINDPGIDDLLNALLFLDRGTFARKCNEILRQATEALRSTPNDKGKAEISIKVIVYYDSGRIDIQPKVDSKLPQHVFGRTPFWLRSDGKLSTQHPDQLSILEDAGFRETKGIA